MICRLTGGEGSLSHARIRGARRVPAPTVPQATLDAMQETRLAVTHVELQRGGTRSYVVAISASSGTGLLGCGTLPSAVGGVWRCTPAPVQAQGLALRHCLAAAGTWR